MELGTIKVLLRWGLINSKILFHDKSATWKKWYIKRVQQENSTTWTKYSDRMKLRKKHTCTTVHNRITGGPLTNSYTLLPIYMLQLYWKWRNRKKYLELTFYSKGDLYSAKNDVYIWISIPMARSWSREFQTAVCEVYCSMNLVDVFKRALLFKSITLRTVNLNV